MISVHGMPMTIRRNSLVWIRPLRVGTMASGLAPACPAGPLGDRPERSHGAHHPDLRHVVDDLASRELEAEERVHTGEVTPEGRRADRVHAARLATAAAHLECPLHVETIEDVAPGPRVLEQV